jgi:hypothetical protein
MPTTRLWIVPTQAARLTERHDVLGPYNTADLAESIRDQYRAEGIACDIIRSATRPVPKTFYCRESQAFHPYRIDESGTWWCVPCDIVIQCDECGAPVTHDHTCPQAEIEPAVVDLANAVTQYRELSQAATAAYYNPRLPDQATRDAWNSALMKAAETQRAVMPAELAELVSAEHAQLTIAYELVITEASASEVRYRADRAKAITEQIAAYLNTHPS